MEISKVNSDLHSILLSVKERTKIETRVATVCKITKVDETNKRLNAKPIIKEKYITKTGEIEYVDLPELLNIPYLSILGVPIVNEYCVIIHLDRSLNGVDLMKEPTTVESIGNIHNISDGIALFGFKETAVNPENIAERLDNLDEKTETNTEAIASLQNKLSGIDLPFNKGQGIVLNTNDTQYKLYGDSQSSNIFWEITKNGHTDYISAQPRRPYRVPIYTTQAASKTSWNYTITFDETLGTPAGILFEHITHYDDYVCTFYPLSQLINITTLLIGYRDCYINFKDMQITYTKNSLTFKASLKGQDGFKANTQGAYIIW